jgi:hypothetical protein
MADKPEETAEKKKGLLGASKVPLDVVLLVVVPFVTFVLLFMYVMGLLPPRPMTVKVVGAAPMEQVETPPVQTPAVTTPAPRPETSGDAIADAGAGDLMEAGEVAPATADSMTLDASGAGTAARVDAENASGVPEDEGDEVPAETEIAEVDRDRIERIKQLAKVYEQMNASSVAAIVTNMSDDDAVDILANMKARNAAKVLASLEPEKAAKLSLRLTE